MKFNLIEILSLTLSFITPIIIILVYFGHLRDLICGIIASLAIAVFVTWRQVVRDSKIMKIWGWDRKPPCMNISLRKCTVNNFEKENYRLKGCYLSAKITSKSGTFIEQIGLAGRVGFWDYFIYGLIVKESNTEIYSKGSYFYNGSKLKLFFPSCRLKEECEKLFKLDTQKMTDFDIWNFIINKGFKLCVIVDGERFVIDLNKQDFKLNHRYTCSDII